MKRLRWETAFVSCLDKAIWRVRRWYYLIQTFRDHAKALNRRVDVENTLWLVASGKRAMLSRDECKQLAIKLGTPEGIRCKR